MEENKIISMKNLLESLDNNKSFQLNENNNLQYAKVIFEEIYDKLKVVDEITLEGVSNDLYSIKRIPTISEQEEELDKSKVLFAQDGVIDGFKIYFTRRK